MNGNGHHPTQTIRFGGSEARVILKNHNDQQQVYWSLGHFYEAKRDGLLRYIAAEFKKGLTYVDIGASIGNHTLFFAIVMGASRIYAIEPIRESFDHMMANVGLNGIKHVVPINRAIGNGYYNMILPDENNVGMWRHRQGSDGTAVVAVPLDHVVPLGDRVDVVKIDVEGTEAQVIEASLSVLEKWHPRVFVEIDDLEKIPPVDSLLAPLGYKRSPLVFNNTPTYEYAV